jgi:transposase
MSSAVAVQDENLELKRVIAQMSAEALAKDHRLHEQGQRLATQEQRLAGQLRQIEHLLEQFRLARQRLFGVSSEKAPGQSELFNEAELLAGVGSDEDEPLVPAANAASRKPRGARRPLPVHLPRVEIRHSLPQDQRRCPCGCELKLIGEEASEQLDLIPARIQVLRHIRERYACGHCEAAPILAPMPAQPIPKSNASPGLLAHITVGKYVDGLPLHRLESVLARAQIHLPRQTSARWMIQGGELIQPLLNLMWDQLLSQPVIHCDETVVQVLKEPNKPPTSKSYMWVLTAGPPDRPVVLFDYHSTRSGQIPKQLLQGYRGYLMSDGYEGYNPIAAQPGIEHLCCMVHARRGFRDAQRAQPKDYTGRADVAIEFFRKLYRIERQIQDADVDTRCRTRQAQSIPVLRELRAWLDESLPKVNPEGALGQALGYLHKYWPKLVRYCEAGYLPIDNNRLENCIRPFVIGRLNWKFSDTPAGAHASAALYSLIETCKACGLEPYTYMRHVYSHLPAATTLEQIEALLPWNADRSQVLLLPKRRLAA